LPVGMRLLYLISLIHIWTFKADWCRNNFTHVDNQMGAYQR
jgi:hypothetical protein